MKTGADPPSTLDVMSAVATAEHRAPHVRRRRGAARRHPRRGHLRRRGPEALELHRRAIDLGERSRSGDADAADQLAQLVAGLELTQIVLLIRMLTRWFQLMNLAEDLDRVRRIRKLDAQPGPRRGSLHAAVAQLAADGTSAEELHETLAAAEVRLVLTAHPTEARRYTTVSKLARIFALLRELDERRPGARQAASRSAARSPPPCRRCGAPTSCAP